jgi:hypothetical protein
MASGGKLTIETGNTYLDDDYAAMHAEVTAGQYVLIAVSDTGLECLRKLSLARSNRSIRPNQ